MAPGKVLLIDFSALFRSAWHANENGNVSVALEATVGAVKRAEKLAGADYVAICCDGKGNWRKEIAPSYKAQREKQPESLYGEMDRCKARLRSDGYLIWQFDGFEADDVIASAVAHAKTDGHAVTVASHDKDLLQLVGPSVDCLRTHTWQIVGADQVREKFGIDPGQLGDWLALVGDKSDNITGAAGIGATRATELLQKFGSLPTLFAAVEIDKSQFTPVIAKSLEQGYANVTLARQLVTLRTDVPLNFAEIYEKRKVGQLIDDADYTVTGACEQPEASEPQKTAEPKQETAIATVTSEYTRELEPRGFDQLVSFSRFLFNSRLYQRFASPEAIGAVIMRGRELGIGAGAALDCFHVIEGRPAMHAYLMIARAGSHPDCEYFQCIETDEEHAVWETKNRRNPGPTRLTYTLEQAKASGLVRPGGSGKPNQWMVRPAEMVRKTCGVQLGRMEYPSAMMGLYAVEEIDYE